MYIYIYVPCAGYRSFERAATINDGWLTRSWGMALTNITFPVYGLRKPPEYWICNPPSPSGS